jgi:hypothetical protein
MLRHSVAAFLKRDADFSDGPRLSKKIKRHLVNHNKYLRCLNGHRFTIKLTTLFAKE